ncbi:MAG TPA: hypothetical protein VHK69_05945, partial [Chitinophagaceae bacterium]|nr:hypothetical protein [Chitinophagaceae bacterium]
MKHRMNQPRVWAGLLVLLFVACAKKDPLPEGEPFAADPEATAVQHPIPEASGIADSRLHPGALWVQEDGGNPAQLYLLGHNGSLVRKVFIKSV